MSRSSLEKLTEGTETVVLKPRQLIHRRDAVLSHAYFPLSGLISMVMPSNGKSVEIGMVGNEGMFGLSLFFGIERCPMEAFSQAAGQAIRVPAKRFRERARRDPTLTTMLNHYAYAFTTMLGQGAACNNAHSIEQRCARWLLMAHDRLRSDEFVVTQAFLAQMLGVRRPSVSEVALRLQHRRLIQYHQGRMKIVNRRGLEELACICYALVRNEFARMRLM